MSKSSNGWADSLRSARTVHASLELGGDSKEVALGEPHHDRVHHEIAADMRANRHLRHTYAQRAYGLAAGCIKAWIALLCAYGAIKVALGVETWSDQVLIAITTGVTVSVLAAFLGVIRGLFPGKGKEDDKGEAKA